MEHDLLILEIQERVTNMLEEVMTDMDQNFGPVDAFINQYVQLIEIDNLLLQCSAYKAATPMRANLEAIVLEELDHPEERLYFLIRNFVKRGNNRKKGDTNWFLVMSSAYIPVIIEQVQRIHRRNELN